MYTTHLRLGNPGIWYQSQVVFWSVVLEVGSGLVLGMPGLTVETLTVWDFIVLNQV